MNELAPRLTDNGKAYIIGAMNGDGITFTKMVIGNGVPVAGAAPSMANPQIEIGFTKIEVHDDYCILTGTFDNAEVQEGFYVYELGVYAKNTNNEEVLYAYRYMATDVDFVPATDSGNVLETEISIVVSIGDADNVTAVLIEGSLYASKQAFEDHLSDYNNPHRVTKDQVGLNKVENNYFYENTITVDNPTEVQDNVATDDTLREAMSKIWYWIDQLINGGFIPTSGIGDVNTTSNNLRGITGDLWFADAANSMHGIGGKMSGSDSWRVIGAGDKAINPNDSGNTEGLDCGYLEIATADNGNEPILIRQYRNGPETAFTTVQRTLYLLDSNGNTQLPGELEFFGGYKGVKWSNNAKPNAVGTTSGDGAYIGLIPGSGRDDLEISTADDGDEQIIVRQRKNTGTTGVGIGGVWTAIPINRTAYLLNNVGNTVFPGTCTAKSHPTSSDLKKKDVHGDVDLETAEALIMGLKPIFYNFKGEWKESAGFGAQDVYKLAKELGLKDSGLYRAAQMPDKDGNGDGAEYHDSDIEAHADKDIEWNLNYTEFIPYLVRVVQEQHAQLVTMQERIERLEARLEGMT